ncbi:MAG: helix-turn-helix domain-containing protein [Promethearchaeota archaeon]
MFTKKIRISPTAEQKQVLWDLSEKCRLIYNFALAERKQNRELNRLKPQEKRTYITYTKQQNDLPKVKEKYPEYAWVFSKVLQMTFRHLERGAITRFLGWLTSTNSPPPVSRGSGLDGSPY